MAGLSSNAFASGDRQNSGNTITDRPSTRVHHAPGGQSNFSFGWTSPEKKAPVAARAAPPPSPIVHDVHLPAVRPMMHAPKADILTFEVAPEEAAPAPVEAAPAPPPVVAAPAPVVAAAPEPAAPAEAPASEKDLQKMTLKEVRTILRERGLNPGGSQGALIDRYLEAVADGTCKPYLMLNEADRTAFKTVNNYSRPDGQNVGNFMTDRSSSRVLAPPGGRSTFSFGMDENDAPPRPSTNSGRRPPGGASQITF
mmetsp:Transcript_325/g.555  ORF Transcript_325/g.555 Transcript_325/m.555 type:complete len:254 (-) Transcript_325:361-1122(-)